MNLAQLKPRWRGRSEVLLRIRTNAQNEQCNSINPEETIGNYNPQACGFLDATKSSLASGLCATVLLHLFGLLGLNVL